MKDVNPKGIQVFGKELVDHVMGPIPEPEELFDPWQLEMMKVDPVVQEWNAEHNFDWLSDAWIPPLQGPDIEEHFESMAAELIEPIADIIEELVSDRVKTFEVTEHECEVTESE